MKKAIEAVSDSLKLYGKNAFSADFVNNAVRIYDEMKSCRVSCDDILRAADNTDKEILSKNDSYIKHTFTDIKACGWKIWGIRR